MTNGSSLCPLCSEFDFSLFSPAKYNGEYELSNREEISFSRDFNQLLENPDCSFCKLMLEALALSKEWPPKLSPSLLTVRTEIRPFAETTPLLFSSPVYIGRRIWLSVHPTASPPDPSQTLDVKYQNFRTSISLNSSTLFSGREVPVVLDNVDLIKGWLSDCESTHKCKVPAASFTGMTFRLIDVFSECIAIITQKGPRYVALSYVWGAATQIFLTTDTIADFTQPGGLSKANVDLPATIYDAMQICRRLGERYLWVDALCIIQNSASDKSEQIQKMGEIYSSAILAIVAACGLNCASGLSGVSIPRPTQVKAKVAGLDLITVDQSIHLPFEETPYNTRGWTFQEYALSHRLLVFLENQIFFYCGEALWHEDTILSPKHIESNIKEECKHPFVRYYNHSTMPARVNDARYQDGKPPHSNYQMDRKAHANHFGSLVGQYILRNLTFESDILNAFIGIANIFSPTSTSGFYNGLLEEMFGLVLLWKTGSLFRMDQRRMGFPSWSWAGWRFERNQWYGYANGGVILLGVVLFYKSIEIEVEGDVENLPTREWELLPNDKEGFADGRVLTTTLHSSLQSQLGQTPSAEEFLAALPTITSPTLQTILPTLVLFKTSYARLSVSLTPYSLEYPYYKIGTNPSSASGTLLDPTWRATQPECLDFVLIALEGTPEMQAPSYQLEVCALIVEWVGGIAQRVAACNVMQSDWLDAESVERVVVLG